MPIALVIGCTGNQIKPESTVTGKVGSAVGQWRGKALVRNLQTGKSGTIGLEILAREPSQLRMEMTGPFGTHLASAAINGKEVRYILTREKRYIAAPSGADALMKLIPVRIAPGDLLAILFERPLDKAEWRCETQAASALFSACAHKEEPVVIRWLERNGSSRRLKISASEAEVEMVLDEARSKVEFSASAFTLTAPSGYRQEQL